MSGGNTFVRYPLSLGNEGYPFDLKAWLRIVQYARYQQFRNDLRFLSSLLAILQPSLIFSKVKI